MPTTDAARARVATGLAAVLVAATIALVPLRAGSVLRPLAVALVAVAGAVLLGGLMFARASSGPIAAGLLGAAFATTLYDRGPTIDPRTPLVAAGLLLLAELVAWSAETRASGIAMPGRRLPRGAVLAGVTCSAWAATTALAAVVTLPFGRDLALTAAGAASVAALTALLLGLAQRRSAEV